MSDDPSTPAKPSDRSMRRSTSIFPHNSMSIVLTFTVGICWLGLAAVFTFDHRDFRQASFNPADAAMGCAVLGLIFLTQTCYLVWDRQFEAAKRRDLLAQLRTDALPERAQHAARVLNEATTLIEELQSELSTRTALLEYAKRQLDETSQRATDVEKFLQVNEEDVRAVSKIVEDRLEARERVASRREWIIGTVVAAPIAIVFGVVAILVGHYVFGY